MFDLHECGEISVVDVDTGRVDGMQTAPIDPKDPDRMPRQLEAMGIDILIAGGVRPEMLDKLNRSRVNLVTGAHGKTVDGLVAAFLKGFASTASHTDGRRPAE